MTEDLMFQSPITARYIQRTAQAHRTSQVQPSPEVTSVPGVEEEDHPVMRSARPTALTSPVPEGPSVLDSSRRDVENLTPALDPEPINQAPDPDTLANPSDQPLEPQELLIYPRKKSQQTNVQELLITINESLQELQRTMIVTHNSMARVRITLYQLRL